MNALSLIELRYSGGRNKMDYTKIKRGGGPGLYHKRDHYKCKCGEGFRTKTNFDNHVKKCEKK